MHVIESGDEPYVLGEQHAVPEHVASHIPDTRNAELSRLGVHPQLPEVSLNRFPSPFCRNSHFLVVVALRSTRGKCVAEPKTVFPGDSVSDIGERCSTLVSGDH